MQKKLRFIGFIALVCFGVHLAIGSRGEFKLLSVYGPGAKPPDADRPFKFAVLGDTHAFRGNLKTAVRLAAQRDCRFLIQLGDFGDYDDTIEYRDFIRQLNPDSLPIPVHLTRGNHETMAPDGGFSDIFAHHVVPTYRTFEYGDALFCILDNSDGQFAPPQLRECDHWIETFRASNPSGPVFLFMHMPPDLPELESHDLLDTESMRLRLIARKHHVSMIFAGHVHDHHDAMLDDTRVVISGCGGGSLRAPSTRTHYLEVTVRPNHAADVEVVPFDAESRVWAALRYGFNVQAMRYRWRCLGVTILLLMISILRWRRLADRNQVRADTADAPVYETVE